MRKAATIRKELTKAQIANDAAYRKVFQLVDNRADARLCDVRRMFPDSNLIAAYDAARAKLDALHDELRYVESR